MATLNLLYKDHYDINNKIKVMIPKVGDVLDNEDSYYNLVTILTAMPIDLMVMLDDMKIDYTTINDYDLFLMTSTTLKDRDTHLVFGDLDFSKFELAVNTKTEKPILYDEENGIVIDRAIHSQIAAALRKINHLEKNRRKPANEEAKQYMLERARIKARRNRNRKQESQLEQLIIAMVNAPEYKYDFEGTRELSIYQFNESVLQVRKRVDYGNRMYGVYAGTIDAKKLSQDDLNWLTHK